MTYRVVDRRRSRQSGATIEVIDNRDGGFDHGDLPWATLCDTHGLYVTHPTRRLAHRHAADPSGWCEACRAQITESS